MRTEYLLKPEEKIERWGKGIWTDEPDEVEWVTDAGLPGLVLRNIETGILCGYVGVPEAHPWHGVDADNIEANAHGGLTFSGLYTDLGITPPPRVGINGQIRKPGPLPGKPDASYIGHWFVGFDCAHAGDLMPSLRQLIARRAAEPLYIASKDGIPEDRLERFMVDVYKDFVWVRQEVEDLAQQARRLGTYV